MQQVIALIFAAFYIILYTYVFMYIRELEKTGCECSRDWKRDFIYLYVCIFIPFVIIRIFHVLPGVITSLLGALTIAFIIIVFLYIHELKKKKCECSVSDTRKVLEIVNYVQLGLLGLIIIVTIYAAFTGVNLLTVEGKGKAKGKEVKFARKLKK